MILYHKWKKKETVTHGIPSSRHTSNVYKNCRDPDSTALRVWQSQVKDKDHLRAGILFPSPWTLGPAAAAEGKHLSTWSRADEKRGTGLCVCGREADDRSHEAARHGTHPHPCHRCASRFTFHLSVSRTKWAPPRGPASARSCAQSRTGRPSRGSAGTVGTSRPTSTPRR